MPILPYMHYNTSNKDRARNLRNNMTKAEKYLWEYVLRKKKTGYWFLRQKMLGPFIVDFYCPKLLVVIEVDGEYHNYQEEYDIQRSQYLRKMWIEVWRYNNQEVLTNIKCVQQDIINMIQKRRQEITLTPNSSPKGRESHPQKAIT